MIVEDVEGIAKLAHRPARHVRFAYTTGLDRLEMGVERLRGFLLAGAG